MNKFIELMYDFFAFALPGACIIISLSFIYDGQNLMYENFLENIDLRGWHLFLTLCLGGYLVGYIMRPVARFLLLINLSILIFGFFWPKVKYQIKKKTNKSDEKTKSLNKEFNKEKNRHKKLRTQLLKKNQSNEFTPIRELCPKNAQFIQFWDMHSCMSHNLAFAILVFTLVQIYNQIFYHCFSFTNNYKIVIFISLFFSFLILLKLSLFYSFWWLNDIKASSEFISKKELLLKEIKKT